MTPFETHNPTDYTLWIHGILTASLGLGMVYLGVRLLSYAADLSRCWTVVKQLQQTQETSISHFQRTIRQLEDRKP